MIYLEDPNNPIAFLKAGGNKFLQRIVGKPRKDINTFFYKLCIKYGKLALNFLKKLNQSRYLYTLRDLCLSGEVLQLFLENTKFAEKGIETYQHIDSIKHQFQKIEPLHSSSLCLTRKLRLKNNLNFWQTPMNNI